MSQENVELTLRLADAWNRRDVEAVVALWDPEGVWCPVLAGTTEGRTYRGHAGGRQYFEDLAEFSEESHVEFPDVHDLGDQVLGLGRSWFRFASGVELDQETGFLSTWRKGKCVEARTWLSHAEALEAVGLREESMSQENVEVVRRAYEAWVRRDPEVFDAFFREHAAPDFEYRSRVLGRVFRGLDGMRTYRSELREIWGDYDLEPLEYIDLGDHVMSVARLVARGVASGVPIDQPIIALWTIENGKLARATIFASREEALEAVGLRE